MFMRKIAFALGMSIGLCAAPAMAGPGAGLNDLEIAHAAYTAGQIDIRYAHLAMALSDNSSVRDFAATMIRDHSAVNDAAGALITELKVTPKDNALSQALLKGAGEKRTELVGLSGKAFDCAYATNELGYHQIVNKTVAEDFIPGATVPQLKALLGEALTTFREHERHAEHMVAGLKCD